MATATGKPTWGRFFRGIGVGSLIAAGDYGTRELIGQLPIMLEGTKYVLLSGFALMVVNFLRDKLLKK